MYICVLWFFMSVDFYLHVSCLEQGANNAKVIRSVPVWVTHLRAALDDPFGSLPTQTIL